VVSFRCQSCNCCEKALDTAARTPCCLQPCLVLPHLLTALQR
jgi:hypothetical protein